MASRKRTGDEDESPEAKRRKREEAQQALEASTRVRDEARRHMFSHFGMWKICPDRRCMRARACRGDVERCVRDRWQVAVHPVHKALVFKTIELLREGVPPREAVATAKADMAHRLKLNAEFELRRAEQALLESAPAEPAPAPAPAPAPRPEPRIRFL